MNEVGAVNEFPEARDDSSILSGKALLTSWNGPVADPTHFLLECPFLSFEPVLVYRREAISRTL